MIYIAKIRKIIDVSNIFHIFADTLKSKADDKGRTYAV